MRVYRRCWPKPKSSGFSGRCGTAPSLSRAELAAKLKISESALYKKLRLYRLG